jgi:hypothetical protein
LLALGDVESDTLKEQGPTDFVLDQSCLAPYPHDAPVARQDPTLRAERTAGPAPSRELLVQKLLIVRMQL